MLNIIVMQHETSTEELILKCAEQEFFTKGFAGARTTSIAESAGVTHSMLHYYFRTKEKLFDRIIHDKTANIRNTIFSDATAIQYPIRRYIRHIINSHLDFLAANPLLPRFVLAEISSGNDMIINTVSQVAPAFIKTLQDKIDEGYNQGECLMVDAKTLALDILSLNIFPFMAYPLLNAAFPSGSDNLNAVIARRKTDNYETIIKKISVC